MFPNVNVNFLRTFDVEMALAFIGNILPMITNLHSIYISSTNIAPDEYEIVRTMIRSARHLSIE
jgi:hypothetical protein